MPDNKFRKIGKLCCIENLKNFSTDIILNSVNLEMKGNREAIIEGCKSIATYDENVIKINMNKMSICFFGRNMGIKCMTSDSLIIHGFITSIEFIT